MNRSKVAAVIGTAAIAVAILVPVNSASASCDAAKGPVAASNESLDRLAGCGDITGTMISFASGDSTVLVEIPPTDQTNAALSYYMPGTTGIEEARVTHFEDGSVGFSYSAGDESAIGGDAKGLPQMIAANARLAGRAAAVAATKCTSSSYVKTGWFQVSQYAYLINTAGMPTGGSARIQAAADVVSQATDGCGLAGTTGIPDTYLGTTTVATNINAAGSCNQQDSYSVQKFGTFTSTTLVARSCIQSNTLGWVLHGDTVYSSSKTFYTGASTTGCTGATTLDLQHIATHETLHHFGLDHVADATQVASTGSFYCATSRRTLGSGDHAGLMNIY